MALRPPLNHDEIILRISRDLADSYDEGLEMEIEDHHPLPGVVGTANDAEEQCRSSNVCSCASCSRPDARPHVRARCHGREP
jgi:hypothetical protein